MKSRYPEAFLLAGELGYRLGARNIKDLPGCWEYDVDADWHIAINAHKEPAPCKEGMTVPPYSMLVQYREWPAGIIDAGGGEFVLGKGANEDLFIAAVKAAIKRLEDAAG